MLTIRFRRVGKKKQPEYRIVISEHTAPINGAYIDAVGHYNPRTKALVVDAEKLDGWFNKGAQPSNSVAVVLTRNKIELPAWVKIKTSAPRPPKKEAKAEAKQPAAAPEEESTEEAAPAEPEASETGAAEPVGEEASSEAPASEEAVPAGTPGAEAESPSTEEPSVPSEGGEDNN